MFTLPLHNHESQINLALNSKQQVSVLVLWERWRCLVT